MACVLFSTMTVYIYHSWGTSLLIQRKFEFFDARPVEEENRDFLEEDVKFQYTNKEKTALAVFTLITIFSIIEIILAAAIAKSSRVLYQKPQQPLAYNMHYRVRRPFH